MSTPGTLGSYVNPIIPGFNPDPSWARNGKDIFLITSTFEYFPGIPIYHSTDLIKWTLTGHALTRRSQLDLRTCETGAGIWASTLRRYNDRWYICTCKWDRYRPQTDDRVWPRGFYVWTDDIWKADSWSEPIYFDQPGFDQDLFWDGDGTCYLSTTYRVHAHDVSADIKQLQLPKNFAIHVSEIDLATGHSRSEPKMIRASSAGLGVSEGSHIFRRGQYYYLITAEGGTEGGHTEWCFRSLKGPFGPWEQRQGYEDQSLWHNGPEEEVQCTGHADVLEDADGSWWAVLLGVRPIKRADDDMETFSPFGRETYLVPVQWAEDWPVFNAGKSVTLQGVPSPGLYQLHPSHGWTDDFAASGLDVHWYLRKTPLKRCYSIAHDGLQLFGSCYHPSSSESPAMFLRKQTEINGAFEAELSFEPTNPRWEAGVILWHHEDRYISLGIRVDDDGHRYLRVERAVTTLGTFGVETCLFDAASGPIIFTIECNAGGYDLGVRGSNEEGASQTSGFRTLASVPMSIMTQGPLVGLAFCGIMFGLYSYGEMQPVLVPATFRHAKWRSRALLTARGGG